MHRDMARYLCPMTAQLRLTNEDGDWRLVGDGAPATVALVNDYLSYLADRNYSPQSVRAYGYGLLAFCRWLVSRGIDLDEVTTDVLLRFLAACREMTVPGRPGPNVLRLDGRRTDGLAPATVNHRLAAVSGLFTFRALRDPDAKNPVPKGRRPAGRRRESAPGCSRTSPDVASRVRRSAPRAATPSPFARSRRGRGARLEPAQPARPGDLRADGLLRAALG